MGGYKFMKIIVAIEPELIACSTEVAQFARWFIYIGRIVCGKNVGC